MINERIMTMKKLYTVGAIILTISVAYLLSPIAFDIYDNCEVVSSSSTLNRHTCRTQTYYTNK